MRTFQHFEKIKDRVEPQDDIDLTDDVKRTLMSTIDVQSILESWGVCPVLGNGQWNGYCPDHFIHAGRNSHAPKWTMSAETGDTTCFTGSFSSNIVYIARRLYNLTTIRDAIDKLTNGGGIPYIPPDFVMKEKRREQIADVEREREKKRVACIKRINRVLLNKKISDECVGYFANDGITRETLDFLCVCSVEEGYYAGRAIIPFIDDKREICGYVAVNYKGKEWMVKHNVDRWCRLNGTDNLEETIEFFNKNYRKTMYCPGFKSREHLYGYYEVLNGARGLDRLVLVEGERDAMKLLQEGINAIALHGTILKDEQRVMIKRMNPQKLFLGFDMDEGGNDATIKVMRKLRGEIEQCFVVNFPDGKDPKKFNHAELEQMLDYAEKNNVQSR